MPLRHVALPLLVATTLAGCGEKARLAVGAGQGPTPNLPAEVHAWIPTVAVADAVGWSRGEAPTPAPGLAVSAFARGLDHPRWLTVLPNGDVLVAETNAPPKPDDGGGIKGWIQKRIMGKAGATVPSANRITLLRDTNGDGVADLRAPYITGLNSPFGMVLVKDTLYVADTDAVLAFPYDRQQTAITTPPRKLVDLPAGTRNHHWTKNIIASPDGRRLFVTVGSNSNVGENGMPAEAGRAAIWVIDPATGRHEIYASGLRNPNGMGFDGGRLWTVVNERDELGSDLVPDYLTSVQPGGFYGWPWRYWGTHVDARVDAPSPPQVARSIAPDYALGPHTASLGLSFADGAKLGPRYTDGAFIGQHGSWNRKPPSGYKVVFVPFADGRPTGAKPVDVLGGFLDAGKAHGRPVGVAISRDGALLVADDVGNMVWRVSAIGTGAGLPADE